MLSVMDCIALTKDSFQDQVLQAETPVLVDCWASWCGSFHGVNPVIREVAIAFAGRITVGRLNIATSEQLAACYGIRVVPTLLVFNQGQIIKRIVGGVSRADLVNQINNLLVASHSSRSRIACL